MKTRHEVLIDAPRSVVWAMLDDGDQLPRWQPGLKSLTRRSGTAGHPGAVSELVYIEGGRELRVTETITERREPGFIAAVYSSRLGKTLVVNRFEDAGDEQTRWIIYANHRFRGLMRFMSVFSADAIRERTENNLERFKLLVESETRSA
jgi:uncharacterized membrane protein